MATDLPVVSVWSKITSGWAKTGELRTLTSLDVEPRHLQPGTMSLTMPFDAQAAKVAAGRMLTVDFRGSRIITGRVERLVTKAEASTGQPVLEVTALDALGLLGGVTAWPVPGNPISNQNAEYWERTGALETVLADLVTANLTRRGDDVTVVSQGRGPTATVKARYDSVLTVLTEKLAPAGMGVRVGLVDTSGTRAQLTVSFYEVTDKTVRVRLSHKVGTLRGWQNTSQMPEVTSAIVGGAGEGVNRVVRVVTDEAAEAEWGWSNEVFVDARDTFDATTLDARGEETLAPGTAQSATQLEASEAEGMQFVRHYNVGDRVSVDLVTGLSAADVVGAVKVHLDTSGLTVTPIVGNPDATDALFGQAAVLAALSNQIRRLEQRR